MAGKSVERVRKTIERFSMIEKGERLLVAVSGGMDSVCLLHVLLDLREEWGLELIVCHLNHSLRGDESLRDEHFVGELAAAQNLLYERERCDVGAAFAREKSGSLQEVAREARYAFFAKALRRTGADKVALGHTGDDNAETVLMRFLKGSGAAGLRGIPPVRGRYIRPLIELTRGEVDAFLKERGLTYVEDSSNSSMAYLRNRVRGELIPFIESRYNPNLRETLTRTTVLMARDDDYLLRQAEEMGSALVVERRAGRVTFDRAGLARLADPILMRILMREITQLIEPKGKVMSNHLDLVAHVIRGASPNGVACLPGEVRCVREYDRLFLMKSTVEEVSSFEKKLKVPGVLRITELSLSLEAEVVGMDAFHSAVAERSTAFFDGDALSAPLTVRLYAPGDRMRPLGMEGHKKLHDLFIDLKVPRAERRRVPLLLSDGEIIWVTGLRQSEFGKVVKETKRVVRIICREEVPRT